VPILQEIILEEVIVAEGTDGLLDG
jgi:hypothetical protein